MVRGRVRMEQRVIRLFQGIYRRLNADALCPSRDLSDSSPKVVQGLGRNDALDTPTDLKAEAEKLPFLRSRHRTLRLVHLEFEGVGPVSAGLAQLFRLFCETPEVLVYLTRWVRLRLRAALWRQWKTPRRRRAALLQLGVRPRLASNTAGCGRGP